MAKGQNSAGIFSKI